jgi:hypothetical protein
MARRLKDVETVSDEDTVRKLLGLTPDELSLEEIEKLAPPENVAPAPVLVLEGRVVGNGSIGP